MLAAYFMKHHALGSTHACSNVAMHVTEGVGWWVTDMCAPPAYPLVMYTVLIQRSCAHSINVHLGRSHAVTSRTDHCVISHGHFHSHPDTDKSHPNSLGRWALVRESALRAWRGSSLQCPRITIVERNEDVGGCMKTHYGPGVSKP